MSKIYDNSTLKGFLQLMKLRTGLLAGQTPGPNQSAVVPQGLGDAVASFTKVTGIDQLSNAYEDFTGKSCGCDARRRKLNMLFPIPPAA